VADIVAVSPDGSDSVNATDAVSERDWMPIPTDAQGRPFSIHVRPIKQCSSWKFSRVYFEIKGAYMFRIRIGNVYVVDWVSYSRSKSIDQQINYAINRSFNSSQVDRPQPYSKLCSNICDRDCYSSTSRPS